MQKTSANTDLIELNQEHLKNVFESANVGIAYANESGQLVDFNSEFEKLLDYSREELLGTNISTFTHGDDVPRLQKLRNELYSGKRDDFRMEKRYITKGNHIKWVDLSVSAIRDSSGQMITPLAIIVDITERKLAEKELLEQVKWNQKLLDTTLDGYALADQNGYILDVNHSYCQMTGYSKDELLGSRIQDIEAAMDADQVKNRIAQLMKDGRGRFETRHKCKDGSIIDLDVSISIISIDGVEPRVAAFARNITERKRTELVNSVFNSISQHLNTDILLHDFCEHIDQSVQKIMRLESFCVSEYNEQTGESELVFIRDNHGITDEPLCRVANNVLAEHLINTKKGLALSEGQVSKFFGEELIKSLGRLPKSWVGVPLMAENVAVGVLTSHTLYEDRLYSDADIDVLMFVGTQLGSYIKRKRAENETTALNESLEARVEDRTAELNLARRELAMSLKKEKELGQLKSLFVSTASHQFRTPLTVIQSSMGILEMQMDDMDDKLRGQFSLVYNRIQGQIGKMTDLMNDVLLLGKINAGGVQAKYETVDLVFLCKNLLNRYSDIQDDGRIAEIKITGTERQLELDPKLMEHAISNVISNAFKYSKGAPNPRMTIHFDSDHVLLAVQDFGAGIPENELGQIFEPFYRATNVENIAGTGLGMAIAKEYLELNSGVIGIQSTLNEGTTFEVKLPQ